MNNFSEFKQKLDSNDLQSWEILKTNIAIVLRNWFIKEYFEANWLEHKGKLIGDDDIFLMVYTIFRERYDLIKQDLKIYETLKEQFIKIASELLMEGFTGFMRRIQLNEGNAWKRLDNRLHSLLKGWLVQKGSFTRELFEKVYSETLYVFCENLKKESLFFENSKKLKSYILRIAENKLKEINRLDNKSRFISIDKIQHYDIPDFQNSQIEVIQQQRQVDAMLELLNYEEKQILYGVYFYEMKLKDIAGILNVSEESCRVKKHRALKKLHEQLIQVPNFND